MSFIVNAATRIKALRTLLKANENREEHKVEAEGEKWSKDVKVKKHSPDNLFSEGSAEDIANWAHRSHKDLKSALAALNFYLNRGGENVPESVKKKVETAKKKLRKKFGE